MMEQMLVIISITFLVMISPGPDMIIVMKNTLIGGREAGIQSSLGVLTGNAVHITYCVLGIGWLISQSILAFSILKYAGAFYLIYLGITSFRAGSSSLNVNPEENNNSDKKWFLQGFISNVLNPKGTLFYLSVFTIVIGPETPPITTLILIITMVSISTIFWVLFVYTLDKPIVRKTLERSQKIVNRGFGVILIGLGLRVATMDR